MGALIKGMTSPLAHQIGETLGLQLTSKLYQIYRSCICVNKTPNPESSSKAPLELKSIFNLLLRFCPATPERLNLKQHKAVAWALKDPSVAPSVRDFLSQKGCFFENGLIAELAF